MAGRRPWSPLSCRSWSSSRSSPATTIRPAAQALPGHSTSCADTFDPEPVTVRELNHGRAGWVQQGAAALPAGPSGRPRHLRLRPAALDGQGRLPVHPGRCHRAGRRLRRGGGQRRRCEAADSRDAAGGLLDSGLQEVDAAAVTFLCPTLQPVLARAGPGPASARATTRSAARQASSPARTGRPGGRPVCDRLNVQVSASRYGMVRGYRSDPAEPEER